MTKLLDFGARLARHLPPEIAHHLTLALARGLVPLLPRPVADPPMLGVKALGLSFPNPVGLAAGFDKDAQAAIPLGRMGFGFVECGTVTPRPQAGNPRPRLFRLARDRAVINRMGFNNCGMERAAANLARRAFATPSGGVTGINIGANKDSADRIADYRIAFARLAPLADYVTVNISSPNTPGLRGLQNKEELNRLLGTLLEARAALPHGAQRQKDGGAIPLLVKIAPDLDETALDEIAAVALLRGIDGLIVSNTTLARPPLQSAHSRQAGGLSGAPLRTPATRILRAMRQRVGGKLTLVGVGGIGSGADAYAKIRAGATLVQLYTALVYEGPGLVGRIKSELAQCLTRDGYDNVAEAVGVDA